MRGVERLQEALREKTEAASRPRERAAFTPESEGAEEPAVVGSKDRRATFTAVKKGEQAEDPARSLKSRSLRVNRPPPRVRLRAAGVGQGGD